MNRNVGCGGPVTMCYVMMGKGRKYYTKILGRASRPACIGMARSLSMPGAGPGESTERQQSGGIII